MKIFSNVIASVAKQSTITRLIFALVFACIFAACGDDSSSSSVSPEPSDDSSSSVVPASSGDESSSSQKNSNKEKSSSSVEKSKSSSSSVIPASSGDLQSSSSKDSKNSSSSVEKAKESSSSVKPSSSSDAKSSSSEEVKQSSSSIVASSSSMVEESSSSVVIPVYLNPDISYSDLEDSRDSRIYKYFTVTGKDTNGKKVTIKVMAQNLNVGVMIDGEKNQEDDSKIERYCYDNDSINCLIYGGLYQWAEVMQLPSRCNTESCAGLIKPNHQGICPAGWRLLTYNDFYIVVHADDNDAGVKGVRSTAFGGLNYTGYSLIGAGMRNDESEPLFLNKDKSAYWYFPTEHEKYVNRAGVAFTNTTAKDFDNGFGPKLAGYPVRCVMVE